MALLKLIQSEFNGVGNIWEGISSIKDLKILIAHLDKYPLLTQKWKDFQLFKQAWGMVVRKEHLTVEGLNRILSIKAEMNGNGLSDKLNKEFPSLVPVIRPSRLVDIEIYDPC